VLASVLRHRVMFPRREPITLKLAPTAPLGVAANRAAREREAMLDTLRQVRSLAERHLTDAEDCFAAADAAGVEARGLGEKIGRLRRHIACVDQQLRGLE